MLALGFAQRWRWLGDIQAILIHVTSEADDLARFFRE